MPDIRNVDRKICTGCAACVNLCPKGAIVMCENGEGFLYPKIDEERCIHCGICYQRCPAIYPKYENNAAPDCYAVQGKDKLRKESSSGGVFSILADYILSRNGYVCGAEYTENKIAVRHEIISHRSDLPRLRGSKYVQSEIGTVYQKLKEKLLTNFILYWTPHTTTTLIFLFIKIMTVNIRMITKKFMQYTMNI